MFGLSFMGLAYAVTAQVQNPELATGLSCTVPKRHTFPVHVYPTLESVTFSLQAA